MYDNEIKTEKALLVSVDTGEFDAEVSIDELEELAHTAGAEVVGKVIQKKEAPEKATFVGVGKVAEIIAFCQSEDVDLLIFDSELSPSQQRNLENLTKVRVIDRTMLILDIFAMRARTSEGKLQVELAQLKYQLPRLAGQGIALSRLGGGIGTRGPGETKLESDKRHIRRRVQKLEEELRELEKRRNQMHKRREKDGVQTVAIVGYTNAGKSTLMNALTDAGVLAQNKLFATLDPTSRALNLPDGRQVMLVDTVGLIRRLPHKLVEAFKSTLEEAAEANVVGKAGDQTKALEYVNYIRERAGVSAWTAANLTADNILDERCRELYGENCRRTDLVRHNKYAGGNYNWNWKGNVGAGGAATPEHMNLFPIPSTVISFQGYKQNPGY